MAQTAALQLATEHGCESRKLSPLQQHFERVLALAPNARSAYLAVLAKAEPLMSARLNRLLRADAKPVATAPVQAANALAQLQNSEQAALHSADGGRFGAWQIVRELGAGGMGVVFLAHRMDGAYSQSAALKLLRGFPTKDAIRRFASERQALAKLSHPNIAGLIDGGISASGQPYLVMDYVQGLPLLEAATALSASARLQLFSKLCSAVAYAHQNLLVHRDIKPSNVLVRAGTDVSAGNTKQLMEPVLLDFGIAKAIELTDVNSEPTSTQIYTIGFASPEQIAGHSISTASDVYSLGRVLEALLGVPEFGKPTPDPLSRRSPELALIIQRACTADPARRYASANALSEDVRRFLAGLPILAAPDKLAYRAKKWLLRNRLAAASAALMAASGLLFTRQILIERGFAISAAMAAQKSEQAAKAQSARAEQAFGFLQNSLKSVAGVRKGGAVDLTDLLAQMQGDLAEPSLDPDLRRRLQRQLAQMYLNIDQPEVADRLLKLATQGEPNTAAQASEMIEALVQHALVASVLAQTEVELRYAERVNQLAQQWFASDPAVRARGLSIIGFTLNRRARFEQAIAPLKQAVALLDAAKLRGDVWLDAQLALADANWSLQRFDVALALSDLMRADVDLRQPNEYAREWQRLRGTALIGLKRFDEGIAMLEAAVTTSTQLSSADHLQTMLVRVNLSNALYDMGRIKEALALERINYEIEKRERPEGAANLATMELNLGFSLVKLENYDEAISFFHAAQRRAGSNFDQLPGLWPLVDGLAKAHSLNNQHALARSVRLQHLNRLARLKMTDSSAYATALLRTSVVEWRAGDCAAANRYIEQARADVASQTPMIRAQVAEVQSACARK